MIENAITFRDLTLGYGIHPAVHHLSGSVRRGSLTAVVGQNGSGKSTLLKGIVNVLKPMAGSCVLAPGVRVAYLPQQAEVDRSFPARVVDLVSMGLWSRRGLLGRHRREDREAVSEALTAVGLRGFEQRSLDTLSGGQLQRALFARVMVQRAQIVLLDEPFNAVDTNTVADLLALIRSWHADGLTVIVVAHDLELVQRHFPQTLLLARRPVAWGATGEVLTAENLRRARHFEEAWQDDAPWCEPDGHAHGAHAPHVHHDGHAHGHDDLPAPAQPAVAQLRAHG